MNLPIKPSSQQVMQPPLKNSRSSSSSPSQTEAISLVLVVIRRWGLLASVVGLILAGGGIALTLWLWEPTYDAKQFVRVPQSREYTDIDDNNGRNKTDPKSIMAPLMNEPLLSKLLLDEKIRKRADIDLEALKKAVRYEAGGGEQYAIVFRDRSPEFAAYVTQKLGDAFFEYHREWRDKNLAQRSKDIENEIRKAEQRLEEIKDKLVENFNNQIDDRSLADSQPSDLDGSLFNELLIRRQDRLTEKSLLNLDLEKLNQDFERIDADFDEEAALTVVNSAPELLAIDRDIQKLKTERDSYYQLDSQHPKMINIDHQISQLRQSRTNNFDRILSLYKSGQLAERKKTIEASIEEKNANIQRIDFVVAELEKEITRLGDKYTSDLEKRKKFEFENQQLLREQEWARSDLEGWKEAKDVIKSREMAAYPVVLEGVSDVVVPSKPVEQYPVKILGLVLIAGMGLPFAAALALELRWRRISSSEQFRHLVPSGLLGEVADLPTRHGRTAIGSRRENKQLRIYEESVDNLSAILAVAAQQKPFVVSVTSAASNEGKTTLATQLALSAARSNFGRTLLIDADLRSPSLHRLLGGSLEIGLGDVLSNTVSLKDAITPTSIENLDLLTAGKLRTNPRRYFSNDQWANLLELARSQYDQIIVDTPPVLAASESLEISRQCDNTLLCVMRDVSRTDSVKRAHDRLIAAEVNVIGCAFGGVPQNEYAYRYGSYDYKM